MLNWTDVSYPNRLGHQGEPCTFALMAGGIRIVVTRHEQYAPDEWVLICEPFCERLALGKVTAEEAQGLALEYVQQRLRQAINVLA